MYKMAPDSMIAKQALPERKEKSDWFTVLVCFNPDGTEKYSLMFIGHE